MIPFRIILIAVIISGTSIGHCQDSDYTDLIWKIQFRRNAFQESYHSSDGAHKMAIVHEARNFLLESISKDIFEYWYGTRWDFNGTTRIPGQGSIACGYFVTHTLTDAGFNIPRIRWAQSASEVFIKELAPHDLKRFSYRPITEVESYLQETGDGLYLVGLDSHVGYILVDDGRIEFIHSNYYQADIGVMSEDIHSENALNHSGYRVIGKLFSDEMVVHWINNTPY